MPGESHAIKEKQEAEAGPHPRYLVPSGPTPPFLAQQFLPQHHAVGFSLTHKP